MNNKTLTLQNIKSWEYGLLQMGKVLPYQAIAALVTYVTTAIPNWHPTSWEGIVEFAAVNLILVQLKKWQEAHQVVSGQSSPTTEEAQG